MLTSLLLADCYREDYKYMNRVVCTDFVTNIYFAVALIKLIYEGRLPSSWTHLITPSRNFVEVR